MSKTRPVTTLIRTTTPTGQDDLLRLLTLEAARTVAWLADLEQRVAKLEAAASSKQ